jgi:hypothetical protein
VRFDDRAGQARAHVFGELARVLGLDARVGERFEDRLQVADRHAFLQQAGEDALHLAERQLAGDQLLDDRGATPSSGCRPATSRRRATAARRRPSSAPRSGA